VRVLYSDGCDISEDRIEKLASENDRLSEASIVAENSDVVILVLGLNETLEGEEGDTGNSYASGDKLDLLLPAPQRALMETLAETGKPVILCVLSGSALDLSFADEHFDAVIQAWYPGARGGKVIAEMLFGEFSPSGKLDVTFHHNDDPLPDFEDYSMKGRTYRYFEGTPLYPFGFGLTYGNVRVMDADVDEDGRNVRAYCVNDSDVETDDVIQVYVKAYGSEFAAGNPRLCGFKRSHFGPREKKEVFISLDRLTYTVVNDDGERISGGEDYRLYVGCSQPDKRSIELTGRKPVEIDFQKY
jgi:beta-glucosidase